VLYSDGQPSNLLKPVCSKCLKPVSATHRNTSNLFTYLRRKHPLLYAQVNDKRNCQKPSGSKAKPSRSKDQPAIEHAFTQSQKYNRKSKKWEQLTSVVTRCVAKDMLPMAIVKKPGFKRMLGTFDPRYQLPSWRNISQYRHCTTILRLQSLPCYKMQVISAVRRTSGSNVNMQPYFSYTVHFISDWRLQSKCLQT